MKRRCAAARALSPDGDIEKLDMSRQFPIWEPCRLPTADRSVASLSMHSNDAGGSTQNENEEPSCPRRHPVRARVTAALVGALLAGCQSLGPPAEPEASSRGELISPLAHAVIGDPADVLDLLREPATRVPAPVIELEPMPDPRPNDVIERLRAEFSLPDSDDDALRKEFEWFAKHPDYLERVLQRASPYLHHIAEALEERGMPADLALLPIVESAFDPFAYSRGRAAGLWQIIPGTARRLDVKQNWWFDGRRDAIESTRGALDYLEALHAMFDGDWLLAVAGYNSGEGHVARALKRAEAAGKDKPDFWSIRSYLPRETRTYVPRLLAIRNLVADAEAHGIELPRVPNEPYFAVVETGGQIELALAAELAGVPHEELKRLNPGFNRWATDPDGPHRLLVPLAHAARLESALAELDESERVQWTRHRIQPGETLSHLAERYGTTAAVLREVNGLRGHLIRAGDHLMIPRSQGAYERYSARRAGSGAEAHAGEQTVHVVQRGESLWSIARRYGVDVASLAAWNGMSTSDTLSVGRKLVVRSSAAVPVQASAAAFGSLGPGTMRQVNYVVRRGDSLSSIARRFRVTVPQILEWNKGLSTSRYLQPGDRVVMFVDVAEQST